MFKYLMIVLAALGVGLASPPAHAANLVTNGDFTLLQPSAAGSLYHICDNTGPSTCTSEITDWSATCSAGNCLSTHSPATILLANTGGSGWNSGFGVNGVIPNPPGGGNYIGIDGAPSYTQSISQTIGGLTVGRSYQLTFFEGAAQQVGDTGATTEQWQVSLGSQTELSTLINDPSLGVTPWIAQTLDYNATSTSEVLTFLALGTPSGNPPISLLSDVSMTVPEPASLTLLGLGVAGIGAVVRRRRKTA